VTNKDSYALVEYFPADGEGSSRIKVKARERSLNPERVRRQEQQGQVCIFLGILSMAIAITAIGSSTAIGLVFASLGTIGLTVACRKFMFVRSVLQRHQRR
jgi:hypothetical protein